MPKERYNIKEFAAIVGRSEQGVYARLSKRLKPYLTERGGVLMLDYKAFSDVYGLSKEQVETRMAQLEATPQRSNHRIRRGRWTEKLSERMAENNSQRAFERKITPDSPPDSPQNAPTGHSKPQIQSEAPKKHSEAPQNHSDTPKSHSEAPKNHSNTPKSPISSTKTDLEQELYEQMKARITDQRDQIESLRQQIQSLTRLLDQEQQLKLVSLHQNHEAISSVPLQSTNPQQSQVSATASTATDTKNRATATASSATATEKTELKHPVGPSEPTDIEPHTATPSAPHRATSPLWLTVLLALLVLALGALLAALYWGLL